MATSEVELSSISGMIADPLAAPPPTSLPATETSPIHNGNSVNSSSSVETKTPEQTCGNCLPLECLRCELKLSKFKSFFFFFGGAIGCVFPYFSIYYKQLGFGPNQIGVIAGVRPLIGFCSGPLWGSLADRFRVRRIMLCCSALGWLIFITSIGFVPPPTQSDSQCVYVAEFLGKPYNGSTQPTGQGDDLRDYFFGLHKKKPGVDPEESLFESRGWAYDRASLMKVYVIIMVLVVLGELVQSPCGALADSGCIETLGAAEMNKYGHQRAWGSLGLGVFSMLVGGVISETRREVSVCGEPVVYSDYRIAFYFFAGCMFCCFVTTLFFRFQPAF
ncbi:MFSD6-like protein [Mya arenaria]|uniref:MFSD6-like protein n=1 Tax=Mya arenaria TaxID=6604 RepID=A0ABY7E7I4_MYAAR|nr:MFSD6-like protein [Mya arenaria]